MPSKREPGLASTLNIPSTLIHYEVIDRLRLALAKESLHRVQVIPIAVSPEQNYSHLYLLNYQVVTPVR